MGLPVGIYHTVVEEMKPPHQNCHGKDQQRSGNLRYFFFCHCEERNDKAILVRNGKGLPRFARNDKRKRARNDRGELFEGEGDTGD